VAFAVANVILMVFVAEWETIPFHLIWVSLTLLYGFRVWDPSRTLAILLAVSAVTGAALGWSVGYGDEGIDELAEVPLMAAMFVAMVWHARRRQAAVEETQLLAERERDLVRDVSHQLRTPITIARGHTELLRAACADRPELADIDLVLEELDRLARISDRFLMLATAEHPSFLRRDAVEIERLVVDAARRWGPTADRRWHIDVEDDVSVVGDAERLAAALDALIENAVKFTGDADAISIVARPEGTLALLEIADTGPGIAAADLPRIFDRFARGSNGGGRPGTGLGLALVQAIVRAHGGSVDVESEPGRGSTFRIRLPATRPADSKTPAASRRD